MKEITITLNKESIYNEVKKLAGYSGKKQTDTTDDATYDVMHITKEEEEMLDQYYDEAEGVIVDVLKPFVKEITSTGIRCEMSDSWDNNIKDSLQETVNAVMKSLIAARWFRLTGGKTTELEQADADQKMLELRRKLYWKRKPTLSNNN